MHSTSLDLRGYVLIVLVGAGVLITLATFGWMLWDLLGNGLSQVSWDFIVTEPENSGRSGGIAPMLVSTMLILAVSLVATVPLGLATAIWLSEFTRQEPRMQQMVHLSLDVLAGMPSIVFGLFGNAFFCLYLGLGFSILSGGLTLACMILPIFIRATEAGLSSVPGEWRRGGAALGMRKVTVLRKVLLPAAMPAISAGLMLGIGRAVAETAVLIFTSGYVDRMPESLSDSGRTLAVHIYDLSMNVTGGDKAAYGSVVVLIVLLLLINAVAMVLSNRFVSRRIVPA